MTELDWVILLLIAFGSALALTWLITWCIKTYGNYQDNEEQP